MLTIKSLYNDIEELKNVDDFSDYLNNDWKNIKIFFQSKNKEEIDNEKFDLEKLLFILEDNKLISKDNDLIINEFLVLLFHCFETIQFESSIRVLLSYLKSTETNYQIQANIKFLNINNITEDYHHRFDEILSLLDTSPLIKASRKTLLIYFLIAMKNFSRINNHNLSNSFKLLFIDNQDKFDILKDEIFQNIIIQITIENIGLKIDYILENLALEEEEKKLPISSIKSFQPTEEQLEIIKTSKEMEQGQVLIIEALAGCTKTSTLEMITKENPESKFLYLAFNKKIVEDARNRFPSNTEVRTLHALAFRHKEADKNIADNRLMNNIIAELFDLEITTEFYKIDDIRKVYDNFCGSENNLDELHRLERRLINEIELEYSNKSEDEQNNKNFFINKIKKAIPHIPQLWEHIENSNITTHGTYLKTFVENNYTLSYDFIVLDESQDVSRVLGKFIINSILSYNYKVIVVGDNNQKIYGFLGNINLSKSIKRVVNNSIYIEKHLTKTFRFSKNSSIETLTNLILKLRNIAIIGAKKISETKEEGKILKTGYLSRGKLPVLIKALEFLENKMDFNLFMSIEQDFDMNLLIDIYELYRYTMKVKNDLINQGLSTSSLSKCDASFYNRNDKDTKKDIEYIVQKFRDNKENAIFPNFINKRLRKISSLYELEYISYKNQDVTLN
ncbi:AAA family ATPase [bacterium]|nr:AAA family ATPase [bacterium]MBU1959321.1 AAA family ATPase [bacterium]